MWNTFSDWYFVVPLILAIIALGVGLMSTSPPEFLVARLCFSVAAVMLLIRIAITLISLKSSTLARVFLSFFIFGLVGLAWVESLRWIESKERLMLQGELTPDNKPTPQNPAQGDIPAVGAALFFGNSVSYVTEFPHIVIQLEKEPLLIINRQNDKITVSGKFFSKDGRIVAELLDNKFTINPNNYFRLERPDYHRLIVFDQENKQTLNLEFMNPLVIKIIGEYYLPNPKLPPVIISEELQQIGGNGFSGCFFGLGKIIDFLFNSNGLAGIGALQ